MICFATCSLILSSIVAFGKESASQQLASSVSYSPARASSLGRKSMKSGSKGLNDLATSASMTQTNIPPHYAQSNLQPNIYHSIIDRTAASSRLATPVQATTATVGDLNTAAGHHHGHAHGKYYEYRSVPKKKTWKFGYKRGNHKHTIERHEHGKAGKHPHFKTKVKWQDKKSKGKGIHLWDYNHHDKKKHHHG